ncbi:MAG: hydrogenase maturation protease [Bifidobacteriaceae bacterium]|jgi:hydrogenase maturation protease|nr:hydrogenase maturation protease [Bifidobacteriaceae bacterium]
MTPTDADPDADRDAAPAPATAPRATVLAVGNTIMADDGIGPALLANLRQARPNSRAEFVDGGIGGLDLLPVIADAERLLVLDAVAGDAPGQVVRLDGDQLPRLLAVKLSPHQVGLLDAFGAARLLGSEPAEIAVVGIVPERLELAWGLTATAQAALPAATALAAAVLDAWEAEPCP